LEEKKRIFWTYKSKVMDVWSFKEKSGQGGHVLEPTSKSWPLAQKVESRKKFFFEKNGVSPIGIGVNLRPAGDRRFSKRNLFKIKEFLEVLKMGQDFRFMKKWIH
jgi:hypothetical protein